MLRPEPYLAAVTALVVLSPAILWNVRHDWTSVAFQTRRAAFDGDIHAIRLLEYLAFVALFVLPTVWAGLIVSLLDGLRRGPTDLRRWFPGCLAVVPIVFFAAIWLIGDRTRLAGGYHWSAPGYLFAFPLLGSALADLAGSMHREAHYRHLCRRRCRSLSRIRVRRRHRLDGRAGAAIPRP